MVLKGAVILKIYFMPNGLASLIQILLTNFKERQSKLEKGYSQVLVKQTVENVTKFSGMLGEDEKMIQEKIC